MAALMSYSLVLSKQGESPGRMLISSASVRVRKLPNRYLYTQLVVGDVIPYMNAEYGSAPSISNTYFVSFYCLWNPNKRVLSAGMQYTSVCNPLTPLPDTIDGQ